MDEHDTIVAIASAAGGALRGVIRVSGPRSIDVANRLVAERYPPIKRPSAAKAQIPLGSGRELPATFFIWPRDRSYTREPTVEIHTIGSPALMDMVVRLACQQGARLARPGEFTLRAFLAGRIDLTQAEAVLGVIDATSDAGLQTALKQLAGGLAVPLAGLREELLLLLADLEAGLDFADEDIEFISSEALNARLLAVDESMAQLSSQLATRNVAATLPKVVLAGPTNAGKSSLFNAVVRRFGVGAPKTVAIESPQPGATRDYLTATVEFGGLRCELIDTAGIEQIDGESSPRHHAQSMTGTMIAEAALVLRCYDATAAGDQPLEVDDRALAVVTKVDVLQHNFEPHRQDVVATSAVAGAGLEELALLVAGRLGGEDDDSMVASTAERSRASLQAARDAISAARQLVEVGESEELVAAELRVALDELGQVAGVVYTDDVLDRVFSRFCIGK